jgi:hypothetical protein
VPDKPCLEGQADDIDEVSDLDHDLQAEFATAEHPRDFTVLVFAAINLIGDQDGPTIFQTPHGAGM